MSDLKLKGFVEYQMGHRCSVLVSEISAFFERGDECWIMLKSMSDQGDCLIYPGTYDELKAKIAEAQK